MKELKSCPFCKQPGEYLGTKSERVRCSKAGCIMHIEYVPLDTWEQRPLEDGLRNQLEVAGARITALREELLRMVETFDGMGSALPGPAFGSGAIAKARKALRET